MYVSSKDVAEMLGKRHDNLLRAIRKYSEALGDEATDYFIPDGEGRRKATFKVTLAGCELLAGRIIGKAGDKFRAWYKAAFGAEVAEEPQKDESNIPEVKEYAVSEVAEMLGMSERSVYRNIQSGKLAATEREVLVPTLKKFITEEALEEFKAKREVV